MKCEYREMRVIAQGDEGLWGKEWYCELTDDFCYEICPEQKEGESDRD